MPQEKNVQNTRFYNPRNPEKSSFYKLVERYFDEFEKVYSQQYEKQYGFWRKIIRSSVDKFLKCGDLKEGFARVKCKKCGEEMFVAFSCRQRCSCPSCHQKRTLVLAYHLNEDVLADVSHRQFVFTIPKRLRIYFRYDRKLLGKLSKAAWETVRDVFCEEVACEDVYPAMIVGIQTFGDLINFHPHIHAIVPEGVFLESGKFINVSRIDPKCFFEKWENKVFDFLLKEDKISQDIIDNMKKWEHSGFSVDNSAYVDKEDKRGMQRLIEYIARCPFSLARIVKFTEEGNVVYRAGKSSCLPFPILGNEKLKAGARRNFEVFKPLDFLAEVTQHIPNKGEHQLRYYGYYSNKQRGVRNRKAENGELPKEQKIKKRCSLTWAMLIKMVYEIDPLKCPKCGEDMVIVSFIEKHQTEVIEKILKHCNLWREPIPRPPPKITSPIESTFEEPKVDYSFFDTVCA